jgi:hypothetical protein
VHILSVVFDNHNVEGLVVFFVLILGAFKKLQKATISFFMSIRLSARNNSASTRRISTKFNI